MKTQLPVGTMRSVNTIGQHFQFVSDSQDTQSIKEHLGHTASGYDAFFVSQSNGDYNEVWGICGIIPRNTKIASKLL